jgi:TetR/AcrR family transcriptional regulator
MSDATKQELLEVAFEHFVKYGYDGARMDTIASDSNFNKATFYYHFKNKENLYQEVIASRFGNFKELVSKIHALPSPVEKLRGFISLFATALIGNPKLSKLMVRELVNDAEHFNGEVFQSLTNILSELMSILKEGVELGYFKPVNPILIHMTMVGGINMMALSKTPRERLSKVHPQIALKSDIEETIEFLFNAIYQSIKTDTKGVS